MITKKLSIVCLLFFFTINSLFSASPFADEKIGVPQSRTNTTDQNRSFSNIQNQSSSIPTIPTTTSTNIRHPSRTSTNRSTSSTSQNNSQIPIYNFNAKDFPGFYDASKDKDRVYNIPRILSDVPKMWASYGDLFKKVGIELGVDPYALAAYCVFESYDVRRGNYNPRMYHRVGNMIAAGIAATQAQYVHGKTIPGLNKKFPPTIEATVAVLRSNPEYGIRWLAAAFKEKYNKHGQDLARAFPYVAYPAWRDPNQRKGAYGTQAMYVSRAYVIYQAFKNADINSTNNTNNNINRDGRG